MNLVLSSFLVFLLSGFCFADNVTETTYQFLIYNTSYTFSQATLDQIKSLGYSKEEQPVQNTKTLLAPNTNYSLETVTPIDDMEMEALQGQVDAGCLVKISAVQVIHELDFRGAQIVRVEKNDYETDQKTYSKLPDDFYFDWSIAVSCPTK